MKTAKKILPKWIIKSIKPGEEDQNVSSAVVAALAMYVVGVVFIFYWEPFGDGNRWKETCLAICILAIMIALGFLFVTHVDLLEKTRIKVINDYKKAEAQIETAQNREEKIKAEERKAILGKKLEEVLNVPLKDIDKLYLSLDNTDKE